MAMNAPLLGVVANRVKAKGETAYGYGYEYGGADRKKLRSEQVPAVDK